MMQADSDVTMMFGGTSQGRTLCIEEQEVLPATPVPATPVDNLCMAECSSQCTGAEPPAVTFENTPMQQCAANKLAVRSKNASETSCTSLELDVEACPDTQLEGWEYTCEADIDIESNACAMEFTKVQRLCLARGIDVIIPADVQRILAAGALEYELSAEEWSPEKIPSLGFSSAWHKFGSGLPTLRVSTADAPEDEKWLCGGEPDQAYITIGGSQSHLVIPFFYLALSTMLTMVGEVQVDMGEALKQRDWARIVVVGVDMASEVVGGSLFVSGLQKSKISSGKKIDQCTLSGNFDGHDFTLGQSCGGLESMRTMGLEMPGLCEEVTTLTVVGLVMGVLDLLIGVGVALYWYKSSDSENPSPIMKFWDKFISFMQIKDDGTQGSDSGAHTEEVDQVGSASGADAEVDQKGTQEVYQNGTQDRDSKAIPASAQRLPEFWSAVVVQHDHQEEASRGAGPVAPATLSDASPPVTSPVALDTKSDAKVDPRGTQDRNSDSKAALGVVVVERSRQEEARLGAGPVAPATLRDASPPVTSPVAFKLDTKSDAKVDQKGTPDRDSETIPENPPLLPELTSPVSTGMGMVYAWFASETGESPKETEKTPSYTRALS